MIHVDIQRRPCGTIEFVRARGHAQFDACGRDIVCAAVSAVIQTAVLGLQGHLGLDPEVEIAEGELRLRPINDVDRNTAQRQEAVLETMVLGLRDIAEQYGGYLTVHERGSDQ